MTQHHGLEEHANMYDTAPRAYALTKMRIEGAKHLKCTAKCARTVPVMMLQTVQMFALRANVGTPCTWRTHFPLCLASSFSFPSLPLSFSLPLSLPFCPLYTCKLIHAMKQRSNSYSKSSILLPHSLLPAVITDVFLSLPHLFSFSFSICHV